MTHPCHEPAVALADAADAALESISTQAVLALVAALPADHAEIIMLRVVAGLEAADVARMVGKTPGAVRVTAHRALRRLADLRASKLPNETGGVLIGVYDLQRRSTYVVDTVPSPPDSGEWPTLYIRGSDGLMARIQELSEYSGSQLEYVG